MIRRDFGLDYTRSGWVISAFTIAYGIGQLPAGLLADRIGRQIMITIGISGVAVAGLLVGLSQTYIMMIVFLVLMGVMGGGYHPAAPPLISASVEPKNRGRALGFHVIGGSASYFLAPLIGAAIATTWGWRGSFISLAVPTILFSIVFYVLMRQLIVAKKAEIRKASTHKEALVMPGRLRRLVAFMTLSTSTGAIIFSSVAFIPLYVVDHLGVKEETAAAFVALIYSAGLWAGPLGGYLSDRFGRIRVMLVVCFVSAPTTLLLILAPYGLAFGATLLIVGMIIYVRMPVSESYIVGQTSEQNRSTVLGIYYFTVMEGGGVLTPVMGYLIDRLGFYPSFTIAGAGLFASTLICSIWLWGSRD
jgi:MFS family permease